LRVTFPAIGELRRPARRVLRCSPGRKH
jgi:hypothetical protein